MSEPITVAAKVAGATAAAGAGAVVASAAPADVSVWSIVVLGIPLSVLAASLAGSAVRYLRDPAQPDRHIPAQIVNTVADGFIGGWLAMLLLALPATQVYMGSVIKPEVVGAMCALLVQFLRDNAKTYFDRLFDAAVSWFTRKRAGGES